MITAAWIVLIISGIWTLAYFRTPLYLLTIVFAAILALFTWTASSPVLPVFYWVVFAVIAITLNLSVLRRRLISDRILPVIRKIIPSISQTEREALEAGTVWWDGELFGGKPDWKKLLSIPAPVLTDEEQAFLDGPVEELCTMLDDWKINNEDGDLSPDTWQFIKDNKFFGMIIPKEYGGLGFSALAHSSVVMKISSRSTTGAVTIMVPNSLGPAELLLRYGTEEQKNHYLPRLAKGQEIPCFALTGPEAGSDASSIPDTGIVCRGEFQGQPDVLGIRLNWDKRYITLGPVATVLGLAFKLYDPDHLLSEKTSRGITLALIPTNTPGISIGRRHMPLNLAFQNGPNSGKDVFIPLDWIIGGMDYIGHGWRMLMECLSAGRSISLPALSTGGGKLACRVTGAYSHIRRQFKVPIGTFEGIEEALARMAGYTYQMDAVRIMTAGAVDQGESPSVISAIAKYNLTERMRKVVVDAMDIHGGKGICLGPRNLMAPVYQAIPISITVEGANILTRSLITFGQGAIRCHPYILKEVQAVADPDLTSSSINFDKALFAHIGFTISNILRSLFLALTGAIFIKAPDGQGKRYFQHTTRLSSAFATIADISLLVLGGQLKRKEKLSGRLADVLSSLYISSATLKHFHDQGQYATDFSLVKWACEDALYKGQESLLELLQNFPNPTIALFLRLVTFPLGRTFSAPRDALGRKAAGLLLEPSDTRDRLTAGIFLPSSSGDALHQMEEGLQKVVAAEPTERKLYSAKSAGDLQATDIESQIEEATSKGIISDNEADTLRSADDARKKIIKVDDFSPEYFTHRVSREN